MPGITLGAEDDNEWKACGLDLAHKLVFCLTCAVFKIFYLVAYIKKKLESSHKKIRLLASPDKTKHPATLGHILK